MRPRQVRMVMEQLGIGILLSPIGVIVIGILYRGYRSFMLTDEELIEIRNRAKLNDNWQIDPLAFARDIEREVLAKAVEQKADLYIVYNGVCISGLYYDAESAKAYADSKQKEHSLSGSIASFHVKEMYCSPLPAQAIPEGWKLVPVEPTVDMDDEYARASGQHHLSLRGYKAMLSASPKP